MENQLSFSRERDRRAGAVGVQAVGRCIAATTATPALRRTSRPGTAAPRRGNGLSITSPARAAVGGLVEALPSLRFDQRIQLRRTSTSIDRQRDAPDVALRQSARQLRPRATTVGRLVDPGFTPAADRLADVAPPLVRRRIDHVGILRVEDKVGDPRVLADGQHRGPGGTTVRGLVQPALTA